MSDQIRTFRTFRTSAARGFKNVLVHRSAFPKRPRLCGPLDGPLGNGSLADEKLPMTSEVPVPLRSGHGDPLSFEEFHAQMNRARSQAKDRGDGDAEEPKFGFRDVGSFLELYEVSAGSLARHNTGTSA
eukprot:scaffold279_cov229-Pinguiococcus_pyrenoidosus.AAC.18